MSDWNENGILGVGEKPSIAGSYSGNLIIVGAGQNAWEEFSDARKIMPKADIMTMNIVFCAFKQSILDKEIHVEHWCSVHPEFFAIRHLYTGKYTKTHCCTDAENVDWLWKIRNNGTTGLFCVRVAIALGYEKILLAGVPMINQPHYYDFPGTNLRWPEDIAVKMAWQGAAKDEFDGRVRSMSGWTKKLLEKPTDAWGKGVLSGI